MKKTLAAVTAVSTLICGIANAETLNIAGFGGKVQEDLSSTLWQPAAAELGLTLNEQSHDGLAAVRLQVQSGTPGWDIVHVGADECAVGQVEGLFEPIDFTKVDASGVPDGAKGEAWVGINSYSVVLAWRTDKFADTPPKTWADFWNTEAFPGRRALSTFPQEMMEIALMADGVDKSALYPLDTARAFASIEKIRDDVSVWWTSGAQSAQLLADGEVDMIAIWGSRVAGVIDNGSPVAFTYEQGILGNGCLAIPKGARNAALAQEFINKVVSPEIQARIPEMMPYYGPTNEKAFALTKAAPEVLVASNTAPENAAKQVTLNVAWWAANNAEVREEYRNLIGQ